MQVQISNYMNLISKYKVPLFLHGIEDIIDEILKTLKNNYKDEFLSLVNGFGVSPRLVYYYRRGERGVSVTFLDKLLVKCKENGINRDEYLNKIFMSLNGISSNGNSPIQLPKSYSEELAYLSGFVIGDGHVSKRLEICIWEETEKHSDFICKLVNYIFNYKPIKVKEKNYYRIFINSAPIHFFFTRVIGMPEGKKKMKETIPYFVKLNPRFKLYFLRGIFDADGGVTLSKDGKGSILLSSVNIKFLKNINKILNEFHINFSGPYKSGNKKGNEIRTFKKEEIEKFNQNIGFLHPIKNQRANALVA